MKTLNTLLLLIALGFSSYVWGQGDDCATAVPVSYTPYLVNMNFTGDGPATGAGASNLGNTGATNADWYSFTAPFNGTMEVNSCFGGTDTRLTILDGTCAALNSVGYSDDNCPAVTTGTLASQVTGVPITAGTTYYIEWDDRWSTAGYDWNLIAQKTSCPDPSAVVVDAVGSFDASVSWSSGGNSVVQYGVAGFAPGTGTMVASTNDTVNLTGLMALTTYEMYVTSFCAVGDSSNWVGPISFTTLPTCPAPTGLSASNVINFSADINFSSMAGVSDIEYGPTGFMPGAGTRVTNVTASPHTLMLSASTSYDVYVRDSCATNDVSTWTGPISFTTLTACPPPSSAMGVATSTSTADISWISNATPSIGVAQVAYGPPGITPANAPTTVVIGSNPGTIAGLTPGTIYDFWLREVCDPLTASASSWIGPFSFQTPCGPTGPASLPWVEDFASYNGTLLTNGIIGCGPDRVWTFETSGSLGRVRVGGDSPSNACGGPSSMTLDRTTFGFPNALNYAIVTMDMSAHAGKNINMNFDYEESDEIHTDDKVWARGDTSQAWVQIFDWNTGSSFAGTCLSIVDIDVTGPLTANGQTLGTMFQIRIGQDDNDDWTGDGLVVHRIELVESTCVKPSAIAVSNVTGTTADLFFAPGDFLATSWEISVVPTGNPPMTPGDTITAIPVSISGLIPATSYDVYVREHCPLSPGLASDWEGPFNFMTGCPIFTAPYFQDFDALPTSTSNRDFSSICWSSGTNTSNTRWLTDNNTTSSTQTGPASDATGNGGNYMFTETSGSTAGASDFLESPQIDVSSLASPSLIFAYHMYGATMGTLEVEVNDGSGYVNVLSIVGEKHSSEQDPFTKASIDLSAFGDTISVKFIGISGGSYRSDMAIDDVLIDDAVCPPPSDLGVDDITLGLTNADLFWTSGGSGLHNVIITPAGTGPAFTVLIARGITGEDYQVQPGVLQPGVSYDFYVQDSCLNIGAGSAWVGPYTFTMFDYSCLQIAPHTEDFEDGANLDSCWYQVQLDDADWSINMGTTGSPDTGPTGDTTTAAGTGNYLYTEVTGFDPGDAYIVFSPPVNIAGLTYPELEFYYHMRDLSGTGMGSLDVFVELPAFSGNYTPVINISGAQGSYWKRATADLIPILQPNDTIVRLAFLGTRGPSFRSDISIDQVTLHDGPACALPFGGFADNLMTTSADLHWLGSAATFNVEYGTAGFAQGSGTAVNGVAGTNTSISGLVDDTDYEFYIQSDCGGGALSTWVGPFKFTTECLPFAGDDIMNPIVIPSLPYTDAQNTSRCFTNQYANANGYTAADVFYEITTSSNSCAYLNITMCDPGSTYDGFMYILDANGNELDFDDDGCGAPNSGVPSEIVDFPVDANTTYYIVISGWNASEGDYVLNVTETQRDLGLVGNATDASAIGASDGSAWVEINDGFAPYTISWNTGDNTDSISGLPAGVYLAAVTDANGCTDFIEVRVGEPCPADLGLTITSFDADSALTGGVVVTANNGTAPYTYGWDNGATTSVQTGIAGQVTYSVTVTDANGCMDSTSAFVGGVNTNQINTLTEYKLFPNPAVNQTQLQIGFENATDVSVELITVDGKILEQELRSDVTNTTFNFDTSEFASGVYMVKIMADNQIMTKRLVVVKP